MAITAVVSNPMEVLPIPCICCCSGGSIDQAGGGGVAASKYLFGHNSYTSQACLGKSPDHLLVKYLVEKLELMNDP